MRIIHHQIVRVSVGLAIAAATTTATIAAEIVGVTASASTEFNAGTAASRTTDGSGLNVSNQHDTNFLQGWVSDGNASGADASVEWIQWDLGSLYTLDSVQVWNLNQSVNSLTDRGINQVDIYTSSVAVPGDPEGAGAANWTTLLANATFSEASGVATYTGFDLATEISTALPGSAVRWVRFEVDSTHGSVDQFVGLSEIRFFGSSFVPAPAPEPTTFALAAMGVSGLCLLGRRRSRRR